MPPLVAPRSQPWARLLNPVPAWQQEFAAYSGANLRSDLLAGLTVGIVALPLALAFGVTSGAGPAAGLFTAIVSGFLGSTFGGSRFQITGPTGAMAVVLLPIVAHFGLERVYVVGFLAGALLLAMGFLRLGRIITLVPWPLIVGFTNGIAIIIALQQVPGALGVAVAHAEGVVPTAAAALGAFLAHPDPVPLALTAATVALLLTWPRINKNVPPGIIALVAITCASLVLHLRIPTIGHIPALLPSPHFPPFDVTELQLLAPAALAVAVLSALESLLSASVADGMTLRERHDPDREMVGQGVANIGASLFGGIPCTGALARTAVAVRSGAHTRLAGCSHAAFLALVALALAQYVAVVPLAVLSGILLVTAYRMLEVKAVVALVRSTKSDLSTMLITLVLTVGFNLILAIEIGMAVAAVLFIQRQIGALRLEPMDLPDGDATTYDAQLLKKRVLAYRVEGAIFFGVAGQLIETFSAIADIDVVILRFRRVASLDASGAQALHAIDRELKAHRITLLLSGVQPQPLELLRKMQIFSHQHMFTTTDDAIAHALSHVTRLQAKATAPGPVF